MNTYSVFIPNLDARVKLASKLSLAYTVEMQDWEYEVSDFARMDEFISEYKNPLTTQHERNSLMEIILDSINSAIEEQIELEIESYILCVNELLMINEKNHQGTIDYWTSRDFAISKKLILNR